MVLHWLSFLDDACAEIPPRAGTPVAGLSRQYGAPGHLGNAVQAAFQLAAASSKAPLQPVMKAASLTRAGMDLERNAVAHVAKQTQMDELHLLSAILRISVRYGGRVDVLMERVASSCATANKPSRTCPL